MIRINLGSILIDRETWKLLRKEYNREDIRQIIVQNGESALSDVAHDLYCDLNDIPIESRGNADSIDMHLERVKKARGEL